MCGGSQAFDGVPIPHNAWFSTRVSCHPMSVHLTLRMALRSQFKCLHFTREKVGPRESGREKKKEKGKPSQGSTGAGPDPRMVVLGRTPPPALWQHLVHHCVMGVSAQHSGHQLWISGILKEWGHGRQLRSPHPARHRGGPS